MEVDKPCDAKKEISSPPQAEVKQENAVQNYPNQSGNTAGPNYSSMNNQHPMQGPPQGPPQGPQQGPPQGPVQAPPQGPQQMPSHQQMPPGKESTVVTFNTLIKILMVLKSKNQFIGLPGQQVPSQQQLPSHQPQLPPGTYYCNNLIN